MNEGDVTLVIDDSADMLVKDGDISARTAYTVDKRTKVLTIHVSEEGIREQAEASDGKCDRRTDSGSAGICRTGTYDYNIESNILTLSEREYGNQMVFEKE